MSLDPLSAEGILKRVCYHGGDLLRGWEPSRFRFYNDIISSLRGHREMPSQRKSADTTYSERQHLERSKWKGRHREPQHLKSQRDRMRWGTNRINRVNPCLTVRSSAPAHEAAWCFQVSWGGAGRWTQALGLTDSPSSIEGITPWFICILYI